MVWQFGWPEFVKKRFCRYLLQHYLGHFFKEKISLEQLTIDIYNGTGCVKNLNLDCEWLNEQLNAASPLSKVPIEIVSGFVGYISVYLPWHDLFNDYCKLTVKNVQITIRTKQFGSNGGGNVGEPKPSGKSSGKASRRSAHEDDDDDDDDEENYNDCEEMNDSNSSMFSSMFVDSLMQTSMHIAQECLYDKKRRGKRRSAGRQQPHRAGLDQSYSPRSDESSYNEYDDDTTTTTDNYDEDEDENADEDDYDDDEDETHSFNFAFNPGELGGAGSKANSGGNNLLGLEAFASTIDSILSRIKINLEQVQIRIENLESFGSPGGRGRFSAGGAMGASAYSSLYSSRPSSGIALELRIKSIKYFDLDSAIAVSSSNKAAPTASGAGASQSTAADAAASGSSSASGQANATGNNPSSTSNVRNTTKSFNIEGLTVYFDEFIVRDELNENEINSQTLKRKPSSGSGAVAAQDADSLLTDSDASSMPSTSGDGSSQPAASAAAVAPPTPQDEAAPFNFELDPDYYLYTNPVICVTFTGIQSIKLTITNMRPTDLIMEAAAGSSDVHIDSNFANAASFNDFNSKFGSGGAAGISSSSALELQQQQRPLLEMSAQFGSIKCLLCPKQIHLLTAMFTRLSDYVEASNARSKSKLNRRRSKAEKAAAMAGKQIRGCDKRKFERLINNDLNIMMNNDGGVGGGGGGVGGHDDDENDGFKSILFTSPGARAGNNLDESSVMFYSMMSESIVFNNNDADRSEAGSPFKSRSQESGDGGGAGSVFTDDQRQVNFTRQLKQTIEELQTDVIVSSAAHSASGRGKKASGGGKRGGDGSKHNLFQSFKVTFRMLSLTVLHHDPLSSAGAKQRLLVDRMKSITDTYFDLVSTIDAHCAAGVASSTNTATSSIDKSTVDKYHQACAFNDHFLLLLKPINLNLTQKINQRAMNLSNYYKAAPMPQSAAAAKGGTGTIRYSLNDVTLTIGYIEVDEYLVSANFDPTTVNKPGAGGESKSSARKQRNAQIGQAFKSATITQLLYFSPDLSSTTTTATPATAATVGRPSGLEQPCFKMQFVLYDPIYEGTFSKKRVVEFLQQQQLNAKSANAASYYTFLSKHFENIQIQLNHSLTCELDISIVDRLYYLLNDVTKPRTTGGKSAFPASPAPAASPSAAGASASETALLVGVKNFEIKCSQFIKLALRFPIADLRRSEASAPSSPSKTAQQKSGQETSKTSEQSSSSSSSSTAPLIHLRPVTMIAFRQLREQILTLHVLDFHFQTLLNPPTYLMTPGYLEPEDLLLTITCSQMNAYYQYSARERPIHFALIQQRQYEARSLIFSIKLSLEPKTGESLSGGHFHDGDGEFDSLKQNYNINVGKANKLHFKKQTTIREEEEEEEAGLNRATTTDSATASSISNDEDDDDERILGGGEDVGMDAESGNDSDSDDDDNYGPFSRIHSLISSEKNRRIVNAGNKQEMQNFLSQSKQHCQTTITINLPVLKLLIADQKFLNDIYNCFLNDLIMWIPIKVPPLEYTTCLSSTGNDNSYGTSINYLINMANYDPDFIATRMSLIADVNDDYMLDEDEDESGGEFKMCKSAILRHEATSSSLHSTDYYESDNDGRRKSKSSRAGKSAAHKRHAKSSSSAASGSGKKQPPMNTMCFIIDIEQAHLKAFVLDPASLKEADKASSQKFGEFDVKTSNFHVCVALSESTKHARSPRSSKQSGAARRSARSARSRRGDDEEAAAAAAAAGAFKIEKQYISLFTDKLNISHQSKQQPLKYPTNRASFDHLFQTSTTKELITSSSEFISSTLFSSHQSASNLNDLGLGGPMTGGSPSASAIASSLQQSIVPMISIGIKSKFNTKTNTKQLLVALNFNSLCLHHLFSHPQDYWIFQLIELFNLIDIEIVGYQVPIVLTELHLNVANSCVYYEPLYLSTKALLAFKSLHWSSNVTAESTSTLLVFNIEDIYLFLSKLAAGKEPTSGAASEMMSEANINLKRDYVCVANSDLFELRLLINDEGKNAAATAGAVEPVSKPVMPSASAPLKLPLLDIKIRSNLIHLRTCVDSAFALVELINYIVSDGDLHLPNPNAPAPSGTGPASQMPSASASSSTAQAAMPASPTLGSLAQNMATMQAVDYSSFSSTGSSIPVVSTSPSLSTLKPMNANMSTLTQAINMASAPVGTSSIPIQQPAGRSDAVNTPPTASVKSTSSSLNQQVFYSPIKASAAAAPSSYQDAGGLASGKYPQQLPTPSLSFNPRENDAELFITDMMKEAMHTSTTAAARPMMNMMTQSVYGASSFNMLGTNVEDSEEDEQEDIDEDAGILGAASTKTTTSGGRKRNTSLSLISSDVVQNKRMLAAAASGNNINLELELSDSDGENNPRRVVVGSTLTAKNDEDDDEDDKFKDASQNSDSYEDEANKNADDYQDSDDDLIRSISKGHQDRLKQAAAARNKAKSSSSSRLMNEHHSSEESLAASRPPAATAIDEEEFQFDMPFTDFSPLSKQQKPKAADLSKPPKQVLYDKSNRRLHFKPARTADDDDNLFFRQNRGGGGDDDDEDERDKDLLRGFDIIEFIPGFGEPPKNNQEFEIKVLKNKATNISDSAPVNYPGSGRNDSAVITIKEDHFKKPLTKIDVLKAPDNYPVPLNVYCVQEISLHWSLYGGSDFSDSPGPEQATGVGGARYGPNTAAKMNRTVSSPMIVSPVGGAVSSMSVSPGGSNPIATMRSRNNSTSSNSFSQSPQTFMTAAAASYQSPPKSNHHSQSYAQITSPSSVRFSSIKSQSTMNFSKEKNWSSRKAGGRITNKYDINNLNWIARGGRSRNLEACMEIKLNKMKTKFDQYADLSTAFDNDGSPSLQTGGYDRESNKENLCGKNTPGAAPPEPPPYLYRLALAIGDIEIHDKLASSQFNMFLYRHESKTCPKHTSANMFFMKFLCSKSMDAQRLLECDIKVSIQPLRFNIDQDALFFFVEYFSNIAKKDLNEFSKNLLPPPLPVAQQQASTVQSGPTAMGNFQDSNSQQQASSAASSSNQQAQQPPQVFIRNFIFSPDLLIRFDLAGKYDKRPDTKMDLATRLLMRFVQLHNTEIKLKRVCTRRGYLGAEKLLHALVKEWSDDILHNQKTNIVKGYGIFNSVIQFFEGFTYLVWCPIEQYRKDGRILCGIQKGSTAFSTCTVLATIELTNRMFQVTKNIAEFFYDLVTPHRANSLGYHQSMLGAYANAAVAGSPGGSNTGAGSNALVETLLSGVVANNRNIRIRRHPNDIREGLTNAYLVVYEGLNDTANNFLQEIHQGAEQRGIPGAIGGALRQLPSAALVPVLLTTEATCNILSGIRNHLVPDEKKDEDQKYKTLALN